jgi:hypothetical protein
MFQESSMSQELKVPKEPKYPPLTLSGWWGDAHYGDNDSSPGSTPEMAAGTDANFNEGQLDWGDEPLYLDYSATLVANNGSGNTVFTVNGNSVSYACGTVNAKKVRLEVGAEAGTRAAWINVTAIFTPSSGTPWTSSLVTSLDCDGIGMTTDPASPTPIDITPPPLSGGATYTNVSVSGTIHLESDGTSYPQPSKLYARVLVSRI